MTGEERVYVRGGEVVARFARFDTQLLIFLLKQRRRGRYDASLGTSAALRPGHPAYDRLRREWEEEKKVRSAAEQEEIFDSIDRKLDQMRQRQLYHAKRKAAQDDACARDDREAG